MKTRLTKHLTEFSKKKLVDSNSDKIRTFLIFINGFLTLALSTFIPTEGGVCMILLLTVPVFIGLGIIFSLTYYYAVKKMKSRNTKDIIFVLKLVLLTGLALLAFPYA